MAVPTFPRRTVEIPQTEEHFHHCIDQLVPVREEWKTKRLLFLFECFDMLADQAENLGFTPGYINEDLLILFKCLLPYPIQVEVSFDMDAEMIEYTERMKTFLDILADALLKRVIVENDRKENVKIRNYFRYNQTTATDSVCVFCDRPEHPNYHCSLKYSERISELKRKKLCFRCLKRGHMARSCYLEVECRHCGGDHYNYLCKKVLLAQERPSYFVAAQNCS
ncbi:hypothetical protein TYRP_002209 [Tyrophagus putrescentiae]|nr:hypothetical protein TYRP_002209 [Tyrophagus putrescentiae]